MLERRARNDYVVLLLAEDLRQPMDVRNSVHVQTWPQIAAVVALGVGHPISMDCGPLRNGPFRSQLQNQRLRELVCH